MNESLTMVNKIYQALDEKLGDDIVVIDISHISVVADYFIIVNGNSISQVKALVKNVSDKLNQDGISAQRVEGITTAHWVLMDYGDVIVHVFMKDDRAFYDLEHIWRDGKKIEID